MPVPTSLCEIQISYIVIVTRVYRLLPKQGDKRIMKLRRIIERSVISNLSMIT